MKRFFALVALIAATVLVVATTPQAPVLHGPIVTRTDSIRAIGNLYVVELTGNPILVTETVLVGGTEISLPEGHVELLVSLRISGNGVTQPFVGFALVIDGKTYAEDDRAQLPRSLGLATFAPHIWTAGTVPFRLPAGLIENAKEIRIEVSEHGHDVESLYELISLPLVSQVIELDRAEVPAIEVVGTWFG